MLEILTHDRLFEQEHKSIRTYQNFRGYHMVGPPGKCPKVPEIYLIRYMAKIWYGSLLSCKLSKSTRTYQISRG